MLERLAASSTAGAGGALASVVVVFAAGAFGGPVVGLLDTGDDFSDPRSESIQARDTIERTTGRSAAPDAIVLVRLGAEAGTPEAARKLAAVARALEDADVAEVARRDGEPAALVSRDRRSAYLPVTFCTAPTRTRRPTRCWTRLRGEPGVTVGGGVVAFNQVGEQVEADLQRAELLAAPILLLFSLLVFRSLVAALLPLAVGGDNDPASRSRAAARQRGRADVDVRDQPHHGARARPGDRLLAVHGLALPRGARGRRGPPRALRATVRTAGRTVLFSAFTVAAALAAMLVFHAALPLLDGRRRRARGAERRARLADAAARAAGGARAARERARPARWQVAMQRDAAHVQAGPWYRFSRAVMRRPGPVAAARRRAADRAGAAVPAGRVHRRRRVGAAAGEARRAWSTTRCAREFPPGPTSPSRGGGRRRARPRGGARTTRAAWRRSTAWRREPPEQAGGYWLIDVVPGAAALSDAAQEVVRDIRALDAPFPVQVGGETAAFLDQQTSLGDSLPLALALLCDDDAA